MAELVSILSCTFLPFRIVTRVTIGHIAVNELNNFKKIYSQLSANGHFRKRTALLMDTFSNSRGCPLKRELTVVYLPFDFFGGASGTHFCVIFSLSC